jgi:hypothetical protein
MNARRAIAVINVLCILASGCSTHASRQARKATPTSFMGADAALLEKSAKGPALMRYDSPNADWTAYRTLLIEPVQYWLDPDQKDKMTPDDRKELADYMFSDLQQRLSKSWKIVRQPGPGTLRLKAAIVQAKGSNAAALDTMSNAVPMAVALSGLKNAVAGKPPAAGDVRLELKELDAKSGVLVAAAVDRRVGATGAPGSKLKSWDDVEATLRYWASQTAFRLCESRGRADCEQPPETSPKTGTSK